MTDAKLVEDAFERRLSKLPSSNGVSLPNDASPLAQIAGSQETATGKSTGPSQANGIDKSILAVAAPRRYRNREHLRYVAQQACLLCGRKPSDPHHLGLSSHARLAARPAMNSRFLSAGCITARCIAPRRARLVETDRHRPNEDCRRLWKETHGMGKGRAEPPASPRPNGAAASPDPQNEDIRIPARTQEETRLTDASASLPRALDQQ